MGNKCCGVVDLSRRKLEAREEGTELVSKSVDEASMAIVSTMKLEVRLKCEGLPPFEGKPEAEKYVVCYKIEHGNSQEIYKWTEKFDNNTRPKLSKPFVLPYEMGTDQATKISLYRYEDVKELRDGKHKTPYGNVFFNLNEAIVSPIHEVRLKMVATGEGSKDDQTYLTVSLAEKKQENLAQLVVQFEVVESRLKGPLFFRCYQHVGDGLKFLYQSENAYAERQTPSVFSFLPLILSSEQFEGVWEDKSLVFQFSDGSRSSKKDPAKTGLVKEEANQLATCTLLIKDLIQPELQELSLPTKHKKFGRVLLRNRLVEPILTLGSILFSGIKVVPIIAVDYSLGNLTFDNNKCMHHFDKIRPNYYVEALNQIEARVAPFYSAMLAYGFGAKLVPKKSKLSSCFALNGNIFDPIVKSREELVAAYTQTLKTVELCLPVNYSEVIRTAKKIARCELQEYHRRYRFNQRNLNSSTNTQAMALKNYYVLYIVTAGVLDDADEALAECGDVAELPLSIVLVKIGNQQMRDVDDLLDIEKKIETTCCRKRGFMSIIEFDRVYNDLANFGKFFISSVPVQILQFLKLAQRKMSGALSDPFPQFLSASPSPSAPAPGSITAEVRGKPEENEKEELKQQGLEPLLADNLQGYFESMKVEYYQKLREKSVPTSDVESILKGGIADIDADLPPLTAKYKKA